MFLCCLHAFIFLFRLVMHLKNRKFAIGKPNLIFIIRTLERNPACKPEKY